MNVFAEKGKKLILGRQGENLVTTIRFPIEKWVSEFGEGTFSLVHQRSGDTAAYPCTTTRSGNEILWSVSSADVRDIGDGRAQLSLTIGSKIAKSEVFHTSTLRSLDATANPPSAWQSWVDQVLAAGTAATTAVSHYPRINSSNNHWEVWSNGSWADTGVLAEGSTPVITSSKTGNTTTVKADGTTIATLLDGTNGTDGHSPSITASKTGGVTTVKVDGSAVATINDGTDASVTHDAVVEAIGYTPLSDVKVGGTSIVTDGVATVPIASSTQSGTVVVGAGLEMVSNGTTIRTKVASSSVIDARTTYNSITPQNIDYAVKSAITAPIGTAGVVDGVYNYPSYTAEEMARARARIGAKESYELIADIVNEENDIIDINVSVDSLGNQFSLKKLYVIAYSEQEVNIGSSVYLGINNSSYSFFVNGGQNFVLEYDLSTNFCFLTYRNAGSSRNATVSNRFIRYIEQDSITYVKLHSDASAGNRLISGLKFKVYGVRA